jgi:triosephosphate isomerase
LAEREAGITNEVCGRQLAAIASFLQADDWNKVVVAYEPKWAIGTGKVASPEQAEDAHAACRNWLATNVGDTVANSTRIIYGGSVNAKNCGVLIECPNIDGFLVGGASLTADFVTIMQVEYYESL